MDDGDDGDDGGDVDDGDDVDDDDDMDGGDDVDEEDDDEDDNGDDFDIDYKINHAPPRNVMFWLKMSGVKFLLTTHTRPQWKAHLDKKS